MSLSASTLVAFLLLGDPPDKLKTLDEIRHDLLKMMTPDLPSQKKELPHSKRISAMISEPSGSFMMRESGSKTRSLHNTKNSDVKGYAPSNTSSITVSSSHRLNILPEFEFNSSRRGTPFERGGKHRSTSSPMRAPFNFTVSTSVLTNNLSLNSYLAPETPKTISNNPVSFPKLLTTQKTTTINANEKAARRASIKTKENENVQEDMNANSKIPAPPELPLNFNSSHLKSLAFLKTPFQEKKARSFDRPHTLPRNLSEELFQVLTRRNKNLLIATEATETKKHIQKILAPQKSTKIGRQTKTTSSLKALSEKAFKIRSLAAKTAKQKGNTDKVDLLAFIQAKKLKAPTPQASKPHLPNPVAMKSAVIHTLRSALKTGTPLISSNLTQGC